MRAVLIGPEGSGKTTVFTALTGVEPGKKEESIGTLKVPDKRIDFTATIFHPKKLVYAEFVLTDINASGQSKAILCPKTKEAAQKAEMLIVVARNFPSQMTDAPADPIADYRKIIDELIITDYIVIENRLEREKKDRKPLQEHAVLTKLLGELGNSKLPAEGLLTEDELRLVANYNFLTLKKRMVLVNQPEDNLVIAPHVEQKLKEDGVAFFPICAPLQREVSAFSPAERGSFLASYGLTESAGETFIREAYNALGLISFLTVGEDECRAWPIRKGMTALEAASKIHSDIARGFIRAETIRYENFVKYGSEAECKKAGAFRLEGKEYIVNDGDIIHFRFNV